MAMAETLQTDRLTLRLLRPDHLDVVHALFSSDGHTIGDGPVRDRAESAAWLARREMRYLKQGLAWYGLWDANEAFLGSCGAFIGERCGDEPEIGYEVGVSHRGHGFAREAAQAVGFRQHPWPQSSSRILDPLGDGWKLAQFNRGFCL
jgi:RimJ/RimL family protein N-acetyltransferase